MKFDPSVSTDQIPQLIINAIAMGTSKAWTARFQSIDDQMRDPLMEGFLVQQYEMECAMLRLTRHVQEERGAVDIRQADIATHRLLSFLAALTRVHERLSSAGAKKLESKVRGALTDKAQSLASIAFELATVTHLMHKNVDVSFNDLEGGTDSGNGGTFDFLARAGELEAEIECKTFSTDIGRKIHRRRYYELTNRVVRALQDAMRKRGSFLVEVIVPGNFSEASDVTTIVPHVVKAIETGADLQEEKACSVLLRSVALDGSPYDHRGRAFDLPAHTEMREFLRARFGFDNVNACVTGHPSSGFAFFVLRSRKPDSVSDYILQNLKDGSKQLSGTRPGIVCAHMLDMTGEEIAGLNYGSDTPGRITEFERILGQFFGEPRRKHVYAVRFSAPGEVHREAETSGDTLTNTYKESGKVIRLKNAAHALYKDVRMEVFD